MKRLIVLISVCFLLGCSSVPSKPDGQCQSLFEKYPIVMNTACLAIQGLHVVTAYTNPVEYKMAHASAQEAIKLLSSEPVNISRLSKVPGWVNSIVNIVGGYIDSAEILSPCTTQDFIKVLSMV